MGNQLLDPVTENEQLDQPIQSKFKVSKCNRGCGMATSVELEEHLYVCEYCETDFLKGEKASLKLVHRRIADFIKQSKAADNFSKLERQIKLHFAELRKELNQAQSIALSKIKLNSSTIQYKAIKDMIENSTMLKKRLLEAKSRVEEVRLSQQIIKINIYLKGLDYDSPIVSSRQQRISNFIERYKADSLSMVRKMKEWDPDIARRSFIHDDQTHSKSSIISQSKSRRQKKQMKNIIKALPVSVMTLQPKKSGVIEGSPLLHQFFMEAIQEKEKQFIKETEIVKATTFAKAATKINKIQNCKSLRVLVTGYYK